MTNETKQHKVVYHRIRPMTGDPTRPNSFGYLEETKKARKAEERSSKTQAGPGESKLDRFL